INITLLLIGNSSVGKSSLKLHFSDKQWLPEDEASAMIGVNFWVRWHMPSLPTPPLLSDTAGQERFRTITALYYRAAQGVILVYNVSSREVFEALPLWLEEFENYVLPEVVKVVVKYSRQVPTAGGTGFAARSGCLFVEASAKTAMGMMEVFSEVVARIIN
ncbi:P-loop containing nucleoside triphosphate hydrolase protein, partial [Russula earlei]